jgi:hypothetical protein
MGAFGYAGDAIIGNVGFAEQWSYDDWLKSSWNSDYTPPDPGLVQAARDNWMMLDMAATMDPPSPTASGIMKQFSDRIAGQAEWVDTITRYGLNAYAYKGAIQAGNRAAAYRAINSILGEIAKLRVADAQEEIDAIQAQKDAAASKLVSDKAAADAKAKDAAAAAAKVVADRTGTQEAIAAAKQAIAEAAQAKVVAAATAKAKIQMKQLAVQKSASTAAAVKTPLIIAALAIPAAIVAVMVLRKKSPTKVAGYRRRSRR